MIYMGDDMVRLKPSGRTVASRDSFFGRCASTVSASSSPPFYAPFRQEGGADAGPPAATEQGGSDA
jgi:hypothetical protein